MQLFDDHSGEITGKMMSKESKILFAAIAIVTLSSCEEDFTIEEQTGEAKMVVNCNLDDVWKIKVYVTESFSLNGDTRIKSLNDASVELYQNDAFAGVLPFLPSDSTGIFGGYEWTERPVPGSKYSIKVSHPKYGVATAEDTFPLKPAVNSYGIIHYGDEASSYVTRFRIQFQDDGAEENFYRINVWQEGEHFFVRDNDTVFEPYSINTFPILLTDLSDTIREGNNLLFSDRNFSGENKEIIIEFKTIALRDVKQGSLHVILGQVSYAHYNYYKTLEQFQNGNLGANSSPVFSNISNGYGIMMGHCIYRMTIPVK